MIRPAPALPPALAASLLLPLLASAALAASPAAQLIARGDAHDARMESREALAAYLEALPLDPENSALLSRISKQYAELILDAPDHAEKLRLARQAVDYAERALAAPDAGAGARVGLAICLAKLGELSDNRAKVAYSRRIRDLCLEALQLDPGHELAHHVLGRWHLEVAIMNPLVRGLARLVYGEIPPASKTEAERLLRRALQLNPRRVATKAELARLLWYQHRHDEARQMLAAARALPPSNRDDPSLLARASRLIR